MKKSPLSIILFFAFTNAFSAENLGEFILHHIGNSGHFKILGIWPTIHLPSEFDIYGINMGITLQVLMLFIAAISMLVFLSIASKRKGNVPTSKFGHAIESVVIYIRDELVIPNIGKKEAPKWLPFFLTMFFFILTLNLLGMIPGMSTVTSNIFFTGAMAAMVFICFNLAGMLKNGPIHYFINLIPKGIPIWVAFILAPIELVGLITKSAALCIRLFANMTAGHIVIFALLGLISVFGTMGVVAYFVPPVSVAFALFISLIEILVCFLQAYVFTLLSTLFVGMAIHQEH